MKAVLLIHIETAETESGVAWWAESAELDGFYAVGDTLNEMRDAALEAIRAEWGDEVEVAERLAAADPNSDPSGTRLTLVAA